MLTNFLNSRRQGTSRHTFLFYQTCLKKFIGYPLTPEGINQFLSNLRCGNAKKNYFVAIRAFCNWLVKQGCITTNPAGLVDCPKVCKRLLPNLTPEQVSFLIDKADNLRDKALISLAFSSGLRLNELASIKLTDIDWRANTIRVVIKGNKEAKAVFDSRTRDLLQQWITNHHAVSSNGSLFGMKSRAIQNMMARLSRSSGIKFSCHSFRRAFASHLRRQGLDISHIMVLGNWQSLDMPLRYSEAVKFEDSLKLYTSIVD